MRLNYTITEELYAEVIEYQMRLQNNQKKEVIKCWINLVFCAFAIYFLIDRTEYSWQIRLGPLVMALILFAMTAYKRTNLPKRARSALKRYIRSGTLEQGFIGPHTLLVENGVVRRAAGKDWAEVFCEEIGPTLLELKSSELLIARGAIYELIPKEVLDKDNHREKLLKAIAEGREENSAADDAWVSDTKTALGKDAQMEIHWQVKEQTYIQGMVEGYRMYYRTKEAWRGSQMVCIIIFFYGLFVLLSGMNVYIGLAFTLLGVLLNRRLFTTITPLAYWIVGNQVAKVKGGAADLGEESFFASETELKVLCMGQTQSTKIADVTNCKKNSAFTFLYTKTGQMYVIPDAAFANAKEKKQFFDILHIKL